VIGDQEWRFRTLELSQMHPSLRRGRFEARSPEAGRAGASAPTARRCVAPWGAGSFLCPVSPPLPRPRPSPTADSGRDPPAPRRPGAQRPRHADHATHALAPGASAGAGGGLHASRRGTARRAPRAAARRGHCRRQRRRQGLWSQAGRQGTTRRRRRRRRRRARHRRERAARKGLRRVAAGPRPVWGAGGAACPRLRPQRPSHPETGGAPGAARRGRAPR
jgi:hypothetical protein